jgi:hypothetical protein
MSISPESDAEFAQMAHDFELRNTSSGANEGAEGRRRFGSFRSTPTLNELGVLRSVLVSSHSGGRIVRKDPYHCQLRFARPPSCARTMHEERHE